MSHRHTWKLPGGSGSVLIVWEKSRPQRMCTFCNDVGVAMVHYPQMSDEAEPHCFDHLMSAISEASHYMDAKAPL